jgi:hypothetical protein
MFLNKTIAVWRPDIILWVHPDLIPRGNQSGVAQVVRHHDARVQTGEIKRCDWLKVVFLNRRQNERPFEFTRRARGTFRRDQ